MCIDSGLQGDKNLQSRHAQIVLCCRHRCCEVRLLFPFIQCLQPINKLSVSVLCTL